MKGRRGGGFTLIELLIVVAIIAILAAIAVPNFLEAQERALRAADASNLHTLGVALQTYVLDYNRLPPADQEAGPFPSHTEQYAGSIKNGPAAGGSLDGVPWLLVELKYVGNWEALFCPKYLRMYKKGKTHRGDWPRFHNFRYAYNTSALGKPFSVGRGGTPGDETASRVWLVRDLGLPANKGWWYDQAPNYPADYTFPWGDNKDIEYVMFADTGVKLVKGGTNEPATEMFNP